MGMIGCFVSLHEDDLNSIVEDPRKFNNLSEIKFSTAELPDEFKEALESVHESGDDSWKPKEAPEFFDVDKAWHGIHFLLAGSEWEGNGPLAFILQGGCEIPEEDSGYGPPHAFMAPEVQDIERALSRVNPDQLYNEANQAELSANNIYPEIWDDESKEECIGYLTDNLRELQKFIARTAGLKRALIVYLE